LHCIEIHCSIKKKKIQIPKAREGVQSPQGTAQASPSAGCSRASAGGRDKEELWNQATVCSALV